MDGPTTTEPTPIDTLARRVWTNLAARVLPNEQQLGHGVSEAMLFEEVQEQLVTLKEAEQAAADLRVETERAQRMAEVAAIAAERDSLSTEAAALREQAMQQQQLLADKLASIATLLDENDALEAALSEARAKARIRPPAGNWAAWNAFLDAQPPVPAQDINAWMSAAIRRLASVGITEEDRRIARLAHMLLNPSQEAQTTNAEAS